MKHQNQAPFEGVHAEPLKQTEKGPAINDFAFDRAEIERHIANARRLRAEALAALMKSAFTRLVILRGNGGKPIQPSSQPRNQALPV